jgi:hypothetical protein
MEEKEVATPEETIAHQQAEIDRLIAEKGELVKKIGLLEGHGHGVYDVAAVVFARMEAADLRDAEYILQMALWQLIRKHGEQMPETGTLALYAKHGDQSLGPIKIAKVHGLTSGSYESGITPRPNSKHYRFWDLTPTQIEQINEEAMGPRPEEVDG